MTQRDEQSRVADVSGNVCNQVSRADVPGVRVSVSAGSPIARPAPPGRDFGDLVDEWGRQSFPASDPPSNW